MYTFRPNDDENSTNGFTLYFGEKNYTISILNNTH